MEIIPHAKLTAFYQEYKSAELIFTKEVIGVTGILQNLVNFKCAQSFFPCVIYSSSLEAAKIVVNNKTGILDKLKAADNTLSLKYCFVLEDNEQAVYIVSGLVSGAKPYGDSPDVLLLDVQFTKRPPDGLIEIICRVLDANRRSVEDKDLVVKITPDAFRRLNLSNKVTVLVDGQSVGCILRNLAYTGARFIMSGIQSDKILDKKGQIILDFENPEEALILDGVFSKYEGVINHLNSAVVTFVFQGAVPLSYKIRIYNYFSAARAQIEKKDGKDGFSAP